MEYETFGCFVSESVLILEDYGFEVLGLEVVIELYSAFVSSLL